MTGMSGFKSFVVEEKGGKFSGTVQTRKTEDLPGGELFIQVHYSSLNYKDALSASGNRGVTKKYPHTPGIDAAGVVIESDDPSFSADDRVIVTGFDLGMNTDGGFSEFIRVPSAWAVHLPENMTMKEAMMYGTAGLTAGISVLRLTRHVNPEDGKIAVSGATGGVGSLSVAILSKLGYHVVAITGKKSEGDYLVNLGAKDIISRTDFQHSENRPLMRPVFSGAIDTVGGVILENIIKSTIPSGAVTCCGNVSSPELHLTVYPFILRGITLIGIDSQNYPLKDRELLWTRLSHDWKPDHLSETCDEITLDELGSKIGLMLKGKFKRRAVVKLPQ